MVCDSVLLRVNVYWSHGELDFRVFGTSLLSTLFNAVNTSHITCDELTVQFSSGVVDGERRAPKYFWGTPFPQIISEQGGTVIQ